MTQTGGTPCRFKNLTAAQRLGMALDAARGLTFLHSQRPRVVHRDFKSLNLLVNDQWHVKVTDFGKIYYHRTSLSVTTYGVELSYVPMLCV